MKKLKQKKENKRGFLYSGPEFSLLMKYSPKASRGKFVKFIPKNGKPFEVDTNALVELLAKHVNFEELAPAFIHNKMINMVRVTRNLTFTPNRDIKTGETINLPFNHMVPLEFAIAEEALGVAHIDDNVKTINKKKFDEAKERVTKSVQEFALEQYRAFLDSHKKENKEDGENNPNSS